MGTKIGALIGLGIDGEEGMVDGAFAGAKLTRMVPALAGTILRVRGASLGGPWMAYALQCLEALSPRRQGC